jgi:uncharacterized membrane protein
MIKKNIGKLILGSVLILVPVLVGLLLWNQLPEEMATHWGVNNEPDGWSSRGMAVFGLPAFLLAIHWAGMLITNADPKSKDMNPKAMGMIYWICPVISLVCCGMVYANALGVKLDIGTIALVLMGVAFIVIGNYMPKCKQNYTLGIKLPWTLNSEANWNATHRISGRLWVIGGILHLLAVFLPKSALPVFLLTVLPAMVIIPFAYSYIYYKQYDQKG